MTAPSPGGLPVTSPTRQAAGLSDPAQGICRGLLHYAATGRPHPLPLPDWRDLTNPDGSPSPGLIRILYGLITHPPIWDGWDSVTTYAEQLRRVLESGGIGTTAEAYAESMLLDAINTAAPDRGAP